MKHFPETAERETRERLLETAGRIFSEKGFRNATVRGICMAARANVAAINYHFGGKSGLYAQAIRYWAEVAGRRHPLDSGMKGNAPPEERLRAFVLGFMRRLLDDDRPSWHGRLMAREMADPTRAMDGVIRDFYRPTVAQLQDIVRAVIGPSASAKDVRLAAFSILGQCLYYYHSRRVLPKLAPGLDVSRDVEELAAHISSFSLSALRPHGRAKRILKR